MTPPMLTRPRAAPVPLDLLRPLLAVLADPLRVAVAALPPGEPEARLLAFADAGRAVLDPAAAPEVAASLAAWASRTARTSAFLQARPPKPETMPATK